ncbi:M48 family metalloprotease [Roseicitreum antarcticum]|uniref:Peptidase family M48 n=1 Tax=Roseicitreum antarcticum TaxID=564137 RepID=A0A1H3D7F3_9RHOB|nr:M48 family metalloprotease [Roseicitreum antarcticum]SDX62452.1 Peptidase family M48 [Roseicitreum antarcticum]
MMYTSALRRALRLIPAMAVALALAACDVAPAHLASPPPLGARDTASRSGTGFAAVVARMKPVSEQICRERTPQLDCTFIVVVDDRAGQPPNAFHTRDAQGRPLIGFTTAMIREANDEELALIFGHEAAHYLAGHQARMRESATTGALVGGLLASLSGADQATAQRLANIGAGVGARSYSKDFELEADRLGTVIAWRAGFDPLVGAQFFRRSPDPGNQFLGTHPPNPDRLQLIARTVANLEAGLPI